MITQNPEQGVILPPSSVVHDESSPILRPAPNNDTAAPLLVFVNRTSGGRYGHALLTQLRSLLNPRQVFDLSQQRADDALRVFSDWPGTRILCCGGDGTASSVAAALDRVDWQCGRPPIAILPLGWRAPLLMFYFTVLKKTAYLNHFWNCSVQRRR